MPGKYFYVKCFWNDIVLGLQSQSKAPGTAIITASHKHNMEDSASQLFYVDDVTGTIRDKVNDYCIEMSGKCTLLFTVSNNQTR